MAGLLRDRPASAEQRARNAAAHNPRVVLAVLAMLALYAYLFTQVAKPLGLPLPEELAHSIGWTPSHVFDDDRNVDSEVWVFGADPSFLGSDDQRLVLFAALAGTFLCAYFLPMRYKRASLVLWFLGAGLVVFKIATMAGLLAAHLIIYLLFHAPPLRQGLLLGAAAGALGHLAFAGLSEASAAMALVWGAVVMEAYRHGLPRLERRPRLLAAVRVTAVQSALVTALACSVAEVLAGEHWKLPLGIVLFFWQWRRLTVYHIDHHNGQVPKDLSLAGYLCLFLTPAVISNWNIGSTIGLGYTYLNNNYYAEEKNKLALDGVKIWGVALIYLVFGDWIRWLLVDGFTDLGIEVHRASLKRLVCDFVDTGDTSTATVLSTTFLEQVRLLLFWAGGLHFRTGLFRVFGYRCDTYYNHPWLATNLVTFWTRFTYHYREFLVRVFFYPVFFRYFRDNTKLRIFVATMAAACFGNLFIGHLPFAAVEGIDGKYSTSAMDMLGSWPYFMLLGLGISFTELYLLHKKTKTQRKPWTFDRRFPLDMVAAYLTIQFYSLIHVFITPCSGGGLGDYARLFLIGLGITV